MDLPPDLASRFQNHTGQPPRVVTRALDDLDGHPGETWLASNPASIALYSRRLGEPFREWHWKLDQIQALEPVNDRAYTRFQFRSPDRPCSLRFTAWDRPELEKCINDWGQTRTARASAAPDSPSAAVPDTRLTCLSAFCAGIHAVMAADGSVDPRELDYLAEALGERDPIHCGLDHLRRHGIDRLIEEMSAVLDQPQSLCLIANATGVALADGRLRSREQELIERFKSVFRADPDTCRQIHEVVVLKNNISIFADSTTSRSTPGTAPTPLSVFCALLFAIARMNDDGLPSELKLLSPLLGNSSVLEKARGHLNRSGLDLLLNQANSILTYIQKRCLLANLLAIALKDAALQTREQDFINRVRRALGIHDQDFGPIFTVIRIKQDLSVFPEWRPPASANIKA
jgi:uncharacterized tellurite resistance protein B-like protein